MQIKMIIDFGAFKKGRIYDVAPKKAMTLLTRSVCVRVNDPLQKTHLKRELSVQKTPAQKKPKKANLESDNH